MHQALGAVVAVASGSGFPLSQVAIAKLGRPGAIAVGVATAAILVRDVSLIATRRPTDDSSGPVALLYAETAVAALATAANLSLLTDTGFEAARSKGWGVGPVELVRRASLGLLFGMHAMRFRPYLRVDRIAGK